MAVAVSVLGILDGLRSRFVVGEWLLLGHLSLRTGISVYILAKLRLWVRSLGTAAALKIENSRAALFIHERLWF